MQHTDKYKFNLIEMSDPFSPEALNKNAQQFEDQLARVESETAAALAAKAAQTALDAEAAAREAGIAKMEASKLVYGTGKYTGDGMTSQFYARRLAFNFKPLVVFVSEVADVGFGCLPLIRDQPYANGAYNNTTSARITLTWEEKAVSWYTNTNAELMLNRKSSVYYYLAIGVPV